MIPAQTVLDDSDGPVGISVIVFFQLLGGAIFTSVGQNVFLNELIKDAQALGININPSQFVHAGATDLATLVPPTLIDNVQLAYNHALVNTW